MPSRAKLGFQCCLIMISILGSFGQTDFYELGTADTTMQGIDVDSSGNMAVGAISSDTALVTAANSNIVAFKTSSGTTWAWIKQINLASTPVNLAAIALKKDNAAYIMVLYTSN